MYWFCHTYFEKNFNHLKHYITDAITKNFQPAHKLIFVHFSSNCDFFRFSLFLYTIFMLYLMIFYDSLNFKNKNNHFSLIRNLMLISYRDDNIEALIYIKHSIICRYFVTNLVSKFESLFIGNSWNCSFPAKIRCYAKAHIFCINA